MNKDKLMGFLYSKLWASLVAIAMLFTFAATASPVLSAVGIEFGKYSVTGAVLSLIFVFGWATAIIFVPIEVALKLKWHPKSKSA